MAKIFDSALRHLVESFPHDWLELIGVRDIVSVDVIETNLSTILKEADRVFQIASPESWLLNLEYQTSYDSRLPSRLLTYSVLLDDKHELPARSTVILFRPDADGPQMTGQWQRRLPNQEPYLVFNYDVIRVWQIPVEELLAGGAGIWPLIPLGNFGNTTPEKALPKLIRKVERQVDQIASREAQGDIWNDMRWLMGLKYPTSYADQLLKGKMRAMKDSVTYQADIQAARAEAKAEGKAEGAAEARIAEAHETILELATLQFGDPPKKFRQRLEQIQDLAKLHQLRRRVMTCQSWADLFDQI